MEKLNRDSFKEKKQQLKLEENCYIKVGTSTCGIAAGANKVYDFLKKELENRNLQIQLKKCGCIGMCYAEPLVEVNVKGLPPLIYGNVDEKVALEIVEEHICQKKPVENHIYHTNLKR